MTTTVTFQPGETQQGVLVSTLTDSEAEATESFIAMLSSASPGASIGVDTAVVNIIDETGRMFQIER